MLLETGKIVGVDADGLWVETHKASVCGQCSAQKGCGQSLLAGSVMKDMSCVKAYFGAEPSRVWVRGDSVEIGIDENALVFGTVISYLLPLIAMVLGAVLGDWVGGGDIFSAVGALIGLALGGLLVRWHSALNSGNACYRAVVINP